MDKISEILFNEMYKDITSGNTFTYTTGYGGVMAQREAYMKIVNEYTADFLIIKHFNITEPTIHSGRLYTYTSDVEYTEEELDEYVKMRKENEK